jgi:pimeloyl-ACP methyl ester carboxylesterase
MGGGKALALEAVCRALGHAYVRFDAYGHGASDGVVEAATIGRWVEDALMVLDVLTEGPQILVGSSAGAWVALLAALRRPARVRGLVGIAAAPDFTEDLIWGALSLDQRREMIEAGEVTLPNCYDPSRPWRIRRGFIEDGRQNLLLRDTINLSCPVRLIQGQRDEDVPWSTALRLAECLDTPDVEVILVKDGDHRLSTDADLVRLGRVVDELLSTAEVELPPQ